MKDKLFYRQIESVRICKRQEVNVGIGGWVVLYAKAGEPYKVKEDSLFSKIFTKGKHVATEDLYAYFPWEKGEIAYTENVFTLSNLREKLNIIVEDGIPYHMSRISVRFSDDSVESILCDTDVDACNKASEIVKEHNLKEWQYE